MDITLFEGQKILVNNREIGTIINVSRNSDGLFSGDILDLDLAKTPELKELLNSYDDAFYALSLMLLDSIEEQIMEKYKFSIGSIKLTYVHLTEKTHFGFRV